MDEKIAIFPTCLKCKKGTMLPCGSALNGVVWVCSNPECDYTLKKK